MSCDSDAEGQEALREQESYRLGDGQPPFLRRRTLDAQESVEVVGLQGFAIANKGPIAVSGDAQAAAGQAFISAASVSAGEAVVSDIALAVALENQASSANGPMAAPPVDARNLLQWQMAMTKWRPRGFAAGRTACNFLTRRILLAEGHACSRGNPLRSSSSGDTGISSGSAPDTASRAIPS